MSAVCALRVHSRMILIVTPRSRVEDEAFADGPPVFWEVARGARIGAACHHCDRGERPTVSGQVSKSALPVPAGAPVPVVRVIHKEHCDDCIGVPSVPDLTQSNQRVVPSPTATTAPIPIVSDSGDRVVRRRLVDSVPVAKPTTVEQSKHGCRARVPPVR